MQRFAASVLVWASAFAQSSMAEALLSWAQLLEDEALFGFCEILHAQIDQSECETKKTAAIGHDGDCGSSCVFLRFASPCLGWFQKALLVTLPGPCLRRFFSSTAMSFSTAAMLRDGEP